MITLAEALRSIYGAYRLALFDPRGLDCLDRDATGATRSFFAGPIIFPAYLILRMLRVPIFENVDLEDFIVLEALAFVVSWVGYALIMTLVARALDRDHRYLDFLTAYNWAMVIQIGVLLPTVAVVTIMPFSQSAGDTLAFGVTAALLLYQWFVARTALQISVPAAIGVVALDMVVGLVVSGFADRILARSMAA